jgi:hypothetical protein
MDEARAERVLAEMNEVIRAGEEMRRLRGEMVKLFAGLGWTQDRIAQLTGMSQPAVSKQVARSRTEPAMDLSLDQRDTPWLEGRLWALAEALAETVADARCASHLTAVARGRKRFTPETVDELRRLVEVDLPAAPGLLATYDTISRGLDLPARAPADGSASARRAMARQLQRAHLQHG